MLADLWLLIHSQTDSVSAVSQAVDTTYCLSERPCGAIQLKPLVNRSACVSKCLTREIAMSMSVA